jgi:hypothetical protein
MPIVETGVNQISNAHKNFALKQPRDRQTLTEIYDCGHSFLLDKID